MKKVAFALATLIMLTIGTGFAAPINDLTQGQTAIGLGTDTFYLEHKLSDNFTLGFQNLDWNSGSDVYGQLNLSSNLRGLIGSRSSASNSKLYLGLAVNGQISPEADGYASLIAGDQFKELQLGANFRMSHNTDLNISYHSYMPDLGSNRSGVGIGATFKF